MWRPPRDPNVKVPVFKNIVYALKLVWQCDKRLLIGDIINGLSGNIFALFVQNILFLKVLLSILDKGSSFRDYFSALVMFLLLSLFLLATTWFSS